MHNLGIEFEEKSHEPSTAIKEEEEVGWGKMMTMIEVNSAFIQMD
jgi:hypothetical protein